MDLTDDDPTADNVGLSVSDLFEQVITFLIITA
jgi:hypothetical protein